MSTNNWVGIGNLTKDPEVMYRQSDNSAICKFTVAINDGYGDKQHTSYIPVVAFGKTAENCQKYLSKGKKVAVTGRIQTGSYTSNKTGQTVYTTDIIANNVEFLTPANQQPQQNTFAAPPNNFEQQAQNTFAPPQSNIAPQEGFAQPQSFPQQGQQTFTPPEGFQALREDDIPFA